MNYEMNSWFIKYKPTTIDEYVFSNNDYARIAHEWVNTKNINGNLLLSGDAGTGKTALAELLINNIVNNEFDLKKITSRSVTEIDTLYQWLNRTPVSSAKKIVFIEEFDRLSNSALSQLKDGLLEKYQTHNIFLCTTNYENKISKPLLSRFNYFWNFSNKCDTENKNSIENRLIHILNVENVTYNKADLHTFVENLISLNFRNLISQLQINVINGNIDFKKLPHFKLHDHESKIIQNTKNIFRIILQNKKEINRTALLSNPLTSIIGNEYIKILELVQFNYDINYDAVFTNLNSQINFLPIKILIGKYIDTMEFKKIPYLNYLSFLADSIESILDI